MPFRLSLNVIQNEVFPGYAQLADEYSPTLDGDLKLIIHSKLDAYNIVYVLIISDYSPN